MSPTAEQVTTKPTATISASPTSKQIASLTTLSTAINPTATPIPEATLDSICTVLTGFEGKASPDGKWVAVPCLDVTSSLYEDFAYVRIQRLDGTQGWDVSTKDLYHSPDMKKWPGSGGLVYGPLEIFRWDHTSRYVFLAGLSLNEGPAYQWLDGFSLYRFDTQIGHLATWLKETGIAYSFAFSPDEKTLVYSTAMDGNLLHIDKIETGISSTITIPGIFIRAVNFRWSPDSTKLVFITLHENWCCDPSSDISLLLLDLANNKITILISHDQRLLYPVEWISDSEFLFRDSNSGQVFFYDLASRQEIPTP
jgi:WD40 repeat protein